MKFMQVQHCWSGNSENKRASVVRLWLLVYFPPIGWSHQVPPIGSPDYWSTGHIPFLEILFGSSKASLIYTGSNFSFKCCLLEFIQSVEHLLCVQWAVTTSVDFSLAQLLQVIILLSTGGTNGGGYLASKYIVICFHGGILLLHALLNSLPVTWLSLFGQIAAGWNVVGTLFTVCLICQEQCLNWVCMYIFIKTCNIFLSFFKYSI